MGIFSFVSDFLEDREATPPDFERERRELRENVDSAIDSRFPPDQIQTGMAGICTLPPSAEPVDPTFPNFTDEDCDDVISKYGLTPLLFDRFWSFMKQQQSAGATDEYVIACFNRLSARFDFHASKVAW